MSDTAFSKQDFETLSGFRYQLRRYLRWSEQLTRRAGITNLQYLLMLHVKGFPGREWATITELAERLQAQHHGVVALVTRCEKLGHVERRASRADGRQVEVHLTRKGNRMVDRLARLHRQELIRIEGGFSVPGKQQLALATRQGAAGVRDDKI
jgi:DNA-binding MarR family transcriptional regulator